MKKEEYSLKEKVQYVIEKKGLTGINHTCHWPGCFAKVKPQFWGCQPHWYSLPRELRSMIWATYTPGQELKKNPSRNYLSVAEKVQVWIIATETWATIRPMVCSGNYKNLGLEFHPL